jgi:endogenous inhibitor of DNA gyrase (YacG/DUF329 family)
MLASIRALCPHCGTPLSGEIKQHKVPKLDNGDPNFIEITSCPSCKKNVYTVNSGLRLDPYIYNRLK